MRLLQRIDVAPFLGRDPEKKRGDTPSVLAMSWGKGDPHKDSIALVFLDEAGRLREHTKLDNLFSPDNQDEFLDIIKRRAPDVIGIGGFSIATTKLARRIKELLGKSNDSNDNDATNGGNWGGESSRSNDSLSTPVIYVHDEVARLYQHSRRANEDFSALSPLSKYCVGLARYVQSPLNEYAALGSDISAITFEEEFQQLVSNIKFVADEC